MPGQISQQVKTERLERLNALVKSSMQQRNSVYFGQTVEVLIDNHSKRSDNEISGRTRTAKTVNLEGSKGEIGRYVSVKIDKIKVHTLHGVRTDNE